MASIMEQLNHEEKEYAKLQRQIKKIKSDAAKRGVVLKNPSQGKKEALP